MKMQNKRVLAGALILIASGGVAMANEVDPSTLYEITTQGSSNRLKSGESGKFILQITPKAGAHISEETPFKLELQANNVALEKTKLTIADSLAKPDAQKHVVPRFEVPLIAQAPGKGGVDGKLVFFICTEKVCARQQKTIKVPVEVL